MSDLDSDSDLSVASGFENEEPGSGFENEVPGSPFTDIDEAITDEGEMVQEIFNFEYSNQCFVMSSLLAVEFVAGSSPQKSIVNDNVPMNTPDSVTMAGKSSAGLSDTDLVIDSDVEMIEDLFKGKIEKCGNVLVMHEEPLFL